MPDEKRYSLIEVESLPSAACPCGTTQRAFTDDPDQIASLHVVEVSEKARCHYHKRMTELYYVLEGSGEIELDGETFPISEGTAILIKPGCRHRALGNLRILNVPVPAFDPTDEWFDDE